MVFVVVVVVVNYPRGAVEGNETISGHESVRGDPQRFAMSPLLFTIMWVKLSQIIQWDVLMKVICDY